MRNPSAFPMQYDDGVAHIGMSLRDYFAAKAMQADMSDGIPPDQFASTAERAYAMADAMMEARRE